MTAWETLVLRLWDAGHDTIDIARSPGIPYGFKEHDIYNLLPRLREQRRMERK